MHPMGYYETLRHGREELLRQAEQERLARQARIKRQWRRLFHFERPGEGGREGLHGVDQRGANAADMLLHAVHHV